MKSLLIVLSMLLVISGCATKPVKYDVSGIESSASLAISDLRPKTEKEQEIFSVMITNDAYAIYRNGENIIDPTALRLFQHRAHEKFSSAQAPAQIKVYHLVSYMNAQSELKKVAVGSIFGLAGTLIASSTQKNNMDPSISVVNPSAFDTLVGDKEYQRALYTQQENPNKATVFVIYIDAEINGKRVFIRKTSPRVQNGTANPYVDAVDSTIKGFFTYYDGV